MPNANHVPAPLVRPKYGIAFKACMFGDPRGERRNCFMDVAYPPREDLLQSRRCHWDEHKLGELAHIKSARSRSIFVSVINEASEVFASGTRKPRLLKRYSIPPFRSDVQIPESIRPEQPLVTN